MIYHILNGDSLCQTFSQTGIEGEVIICRECLIEGPLGGNNIEDFFDLRTLFIFETYIKNSNETPALNYKDYVQSEFNKIIEIPVDSDIILWFEHDLFCQANMWFILSLLSGKPVNIYRAFPINSEQDTWKGFGSNSSAALNKSFGNKIILTKEDIKLGNNLWDAYRNINISELEKLSLTESQSFPFLPEVIRAHLERLPPVNRPEKIIKEIIENGKKDFNSVFNEFSKREGIYGFGDVQIKRMYENI